MNAELFEESETRLQGCLLRVAQAAWILVAVLSFILFVVSLPTFYTQTQSICTGGACNGVQISSEQAHALLAHAISLTSYAWFSVRVTIYSTLIWFSAGWLIFRYKSDYWIALLLALQAVTEGASTNIAALGSFPVLQYPANFLLFLNQVLLFLVFALFPTGRFVPKWIVFAIATLILANVIYQIPTLFNPTLSQPGSLYELIISNISLIVMLLGPVAIYIAIVRYRLYAIDVIINRSLVYGSLTVLLALIYFGLVIGLGSLVRLFTGQVSSRQ